MVKRSRVYCSSGGNNRRSGGVALTVVLVLWHIIVLLCGAGGAVVSSIGDRSPQQQLMNPAERHSAAAGRYADDATAVARNGRSTANLSHLTGTARKIKMIVKNRFLQVFSDGTVNSTAEDTSDYVILQRTSVNMGQLKIQGVATCMYLCMDACGLLYGSKDFEDECVFNEMFEQHHYNTYSSAKYTNDKRTLYLALNKRGSPRKVQVKANAPLGKLSAYTQVLTQPVPAERVDQLLASRQQQSSSSSSSAESSAQHPHGHRHHHACPPHVGPPLQTAASKHRKSGRKCSGQTAKANRKKAAKDGRGAKEDEDCGGGGNKTAGDRCGGGGDEETSHRKADAAGRKKKSKKPISGKGIPDKPSLHREPGKWKKSESGVVQTAVTTIAVQTAVTTIAAPSQLLVEDSAAEDDNNDEDAAAVATVPTAADE